MHITTQISEWRVLVIDDEPDNLSLAVAVLQFRGAITASASSGSMGLKLVEDFKPNLILLDLSMPNMDGWEVQRLLRARSEFDDVPIVAITALAMSADVDKARAAGFDGYITKPFRVTGLLQELQSAVTAFLDRRAASKLQMSTVEQISNSLAEAGTPCPHPPQSPVAK